MNNEWIHVINLPAAEAKQAAWRLNTHAKRNGTGMEFMAGEPNIVDVPGVPRPDPSTTSTTMGIWKRQIAPPTPAPMQEFL